MSIPTATLSIQVNSFRPLGSVFSINATLSLAQGDPGTFTFDGVTLTIRVPAGQPVQIVYQLPDPRYVLLGVAFNPITGSVGRTEFPTITLNRDPNGSQMFVTDNDLARFDGTNFDYVILAQETLTGNIGLIDPEIETEIEN